MSPLTSHPCTQFIQIYWRRKEDLIHDDGRRLMTLGHFSWLRWPKNYEKKLHAIKCLHAIHAGNCFPKKYICVLYGMFVLHLKHNSSKSLFGLSIIDFNIYSYYFNNYCTILWVIGYMNVVHIWYCIVQCTPLTSFLMHTSFLFAYVVIHNIIQYRRHVSSID